MNTNPDKEIPAYLREAAEKAYPGIPDVMIYEQEAFIQGAISPEAARYHQEPLEDEATEAAIFLEECNISGDTMVSMNHNLDEVPKEMQGAYYLHDLLARFTSLQPQSPVAERDESGIKEELENLFYGISTEGGRHLSTQLCEDLADEVIKIFKEWHNKLSQPETPSEKVSDAVAFAEWIKKEGYNQRSGVDWAIYRTHLSDVEIYTTEQLYNLYLNIN